MWLHSCGFFIDCFSKIEYISRRSCVIMSMSEKNNLFLRKSFGFRKNCLLLLCCYRITAVLKCYNLIFQGIRKGVFIMKRKDNSKKIVASVLLLLVMICAAVYGVALYHGTPHGDNYIEMEN